MGNARVGYLVKAFPVVSETFILNEVRAMESHGVPLAILSLKPAPPTVKHRALSEIESERHEAPWHRPLAWPGMLVDHLALWFAIGNTYPAVFRHEVGRFIWKLFRHPDAHNRTLVIKRLRRFAWAGWAARRAGQLRIEHYHAHYATEPLRVAHLVKRLIGIPYSFTAHAKDLYQAPRPRLRRRLKSARFAVSCHRDGVDALRSLLPDEAEGKVLFIRHGVDVELFEAPADPHRSETPIILGIGRLTPKKGFEDLVDACAILRQMRVGFRCHLLGDGQLRQTLEKRILALGLERHVRIEGFVAQEHLPEWYARAAVFAAPCKILEDGNRDGVPNVVLEAMVSNLAVVASDTAGIPEVIEHEHNGLLIEPNDPQALALGLARVLDDLDLATRLGSAAACSVSELSFVSTNESLAAEFHRALGSRVQAALDQADAAAWRSGGLAQTAAKRLRTKPQRQDAVEAGIRRAVSPGLDANSWRADLVGLAKRRLWDEVIKARRLPRLLPLLLGESAPKNARILDLGCGRGGLSVALQAQGVRTTAVDLRYRNCLVARLRGQRYSLDVPATASIGESLPFPDRSFDAVACLEVLEHVGDPLSVLREIRRVLRPTGRCVVTVINRWAPLDPHYHLWGLNHMPRILADRYISLRRRTKESYRDYQTLGEMHYYSYREFMRLSSELGFTVSDPDLPVYGWRRIVHRFARLVSQGFSSVTLVLEPASPGVVALRGTGADAPQLARAALEK